MDSFRKETDFTVLGSLINVSDVYLGVKLYDFIGLTDYITIQWIVVKHCCKTLWSHSLYIYFDNHYIGLLVYLCR